MESNYFISSNNIQFPHILGLLVRQRNSIFLKKRAIASIENVFVYSGKYSHSDLKSD